MRLRPIPKKWPPSTGINYPKPVPRKAKTCKLPTGIAGDDAYEEVNYEGLPSNAPAKACSAECCSPSVVQAKKLTDPIIANIAGEWSVRCKKWRKIPWRKIIITCDGMYKVWNKRASKIVLDGKTFKKKCPKRRGGSKPQWLVPKWAGARKKFDCGWYDAAKDAFNSDHMTRKGKKH